MRKNIHLTESQVTKLIKEYYSNHYSNHDKVELVKDQNVVDGGNFPIKRNGKVYWVSRSNTISLYVFAYNANDELCILTNLRGPKATSSGLWNVVCGYLDYGYTLEDTAVKECWEECGVKIDKNLLKCVGTTSHHKYGDVNTCFVAILPDITSNYHLSAAHCEPGEVTKVQWTKVSDIDKYNFLGGMGNTIKHFAAKIEKNESNKDNEKYKNFISDLDELLSDNIIDRNDYKKIITIIRN